MFFYVLLTPPLIASIVMIWRLRSMEKHDKVVYKFCQLRRDTMSLIRERNFKLIKADYIALREMSEITNATIHDYHNSKIYVFNFPRFVETLRRIERLDFQLAQGRDLKQAVAALRHHFSDALFFAFVTFTPLFKSERVFKLLQHTFAALARLGINQFKAKAKGMAEIAKWIENQKHTPTFG